MFNFTYNPITRLTGLSLVIIAIFLAFGFYVVSAINEIQDYNALNYRLDNILYHTNQCRIAKEEFLLGAYTDENFVTKGTNASYEAFRRSKDSVTAKLATIATDPILRHLDRTAFVKSISTDFEEYDRLFIQIAALMKEKGFKDLGIEGKMREAIHFIENSPSGIDKVSLLTLRRHEKDFILRKDFQYVDKFRQEFDKFQKQIANLETGDTEKKADLAALVAYRENFEKLVSVEKQIGLKADEGIRRQLADKYTALESQINNLVSQLKVATVSKNREVNFNIMLLFLIVMAAFVWALRFLLLSVAKPIGELRQAADRISKGNLNVNIEDVKSSRLLVRLIDSFGSILEKLKTVMTQIEAISVRKIKEELPLTDQDDEVTKILNKIIRELRQIDEEEAKRTWFTQGLAQTADLLRLSQSEAGKNRYDSVIKNFVTTLSANQGALFVIENEDDTEAAHLEMKACYAYDRKKYLDKKIYKGEGLAGQVWQEGDTVLLTEIPADYVEITSGLGQANPSSIVIVPLKINGPGGGYRRTGFFQGF